MSDNKRIVICGTNWLGDSVMSMPAIQAFKQKRPADRLTVAAREAVAPLWALHPDVDQCISYRPTHGGTVRVCRALRRQEADEAYIFPNSFRTALIPFLGGVARRTGLRGHGRRLLLTDVVVLSPAARAGHQSCEYMEILQLDREAAPPAPRLKIPEGLAEAVAERLGMNLADPVVALMPGAARGPSKRWPEEHFVAVGRWLAERGITVAVLGGAAEQAICASVCADVGASANNLAGRTGLAELAAVLGHCRAAVTNDSGGMHLAAAAGTRVVGVFGRTDPHKTGPLGEGHRVIAADGVARARDIARSSREAIQCLRAIRPQRVIGALREILDEDPP